MHCCAGADRPDSRVNSRRWSGSSENRPTRYSGGCSRAQPARLSEHGSTWRPEPRRSGRHVGQRLPRRSSGRVPHGRKRPDPSTHPPPSARPPSAGLPSARPPRAGPPSPPPPRPLSYSSTPPHLHLLCTPAETPNTHFRSSAAACASLAAASATLFASPARRTASSACLVASSAATRERAPVFFAESAASRAAAWAFSFSVRSMCTFSRKHVVPN